MRVLLTGGTGTLGNELLKKFHREWDITVLSRDELKQARCQSLFPNVRFLIGDIRDYASVLKATRGIDVVIHCAAMKRIEICEVNPIEAVKTNVLGTENVVTASQERGIAKLISISSDKSVEPVNVYGMTKAIQEKIVIAAGYNCARYGNVFGSRGSVIPLFAEQKQAGGPLTVTDPAMTRFILTTDEAIKLVLLALERPMAGKIFVKKSPAATIGDIAACFSAPIKVTGKMTGEKLHETLISREETTRVKDLGDHFEIVEKTLTSTYGEPYSSDRERKMTREEISALIATYRTTTHPT